MIYFSIIVPAQDEAKESKMRVASLVEEVQSAQDKRSALYQSYDDAIDKFKAGKDHGNFTSQRKKIDGDYKQLTSQIQNLQAQLKTEGSDLSEKVCYFNVNQCLYNTVLSSSIRSSLTRDSASLLKVLVLTRCHCMTKIILREAPRVFLHESWKWPRDVSC